jgi:hypothetical protein
MIEAGNYIFRDRFTTDAMEAVAPDNEITVKFVVLAS